MIISNIKMDSRIFDTIHDILRPERLARSLLKGLNAPIWRTAKRGVKVAHQVWRFGGLAGRSRSRAGPSQARRWRSTRTASPSVSRRSHPAAGNTVSARVWRCPRHYSKSLCNLVYWGFASEYLKAAFQLFRITLITHRRSLKKLQIENSLQCIDPYFAISKSPKWRKIRVDAPCR